MSNAELLQHKILAHREKLKRERDHIKAQRTAFEISAPLLFKGIAEALEKIDGVDVNAMGASDHHPASNAGWLEIHVLDRKVRFVSADQNGQLFLEVTGLFDRKLDFWLQQDGKWVADDERSSSTITFSNELLFTRLAALVP